MRKNAEPIAIGIGSTAAAKSPFCLAAQGEFETSDRFTRHRISHLLVETRIGFAWIEAATQKHRRIIEVDWLIVGIVARIIVDHDEILADRTWLQRLISYVDRHIIAQVPTLRRIECVGFQGTLWRGVILSIVGHSFS